ncbi:MAG: histidine phosphatase family protein [Planctomycetes bacterium]|nr:histidine phosphatase family protein [Planctomycetota bacterium]
MRLVRHGEVAAEHRGRFYGCADVPLSEAGQAASVALAARLAEQPWDVIASSPLRRALAVAEPVAAALGRPLRVVADLRELDRGRWTHLHKDDLERDHPGAIARYLADPEGGAAPGGETESQLCARVFAAVDALVAETDGGRLLLVAHGHVIRVLMRRVTGWDAPASLLRFVPYHAQVDLVLRRDGSGRLLGDPDVELPEALHLPS